MANIFELQQQIDRQCTEDWQKFERKYSTYEPQEDVDPKTLLYRRSFVSKAKQYTDLISQAYGDIMQCVSYFVENDEFEKAHYIIRRMYTTLLELFEFFDALKKSKPSDDIVDDEVVDTPKKS